MDRLIRITVKKRTWPPRGQLPRFPKSFHAGHQLYDMNIPSMLLMIGYLTTPAATTGVSLSEYWAWVRYLAAFTDDNELRITSSFSSLDAHQKTILSDDFGMGVPMLWLGDRLSLELIVDGNYFLQKFGASVNAAQRRTAKRGPNKTPDFVAKDVQGVWHIVECKGTQSGIDYSNRQLGIAGPPPTGGVAQKRSIIFPPEHTGQRLVCGLSIGTENGSPSSLTIIDPKPEEPFVVSTNQMNLANDAAIRGVVSKSLRMAGFETSAEATASPLGPSPSTIRHSTVRLEKIRKEFVDEREARAREELGTRSRRTAVFDGRYRGRELSLDLPKPIIVNGEHISRVIVRQGVNDEVLAQLQEQPTYSEPAFDSRFDWTKNIRKQIIGGDTKTAFMQIGDVFRSELILE